MRCAIKCIKCVTDRVVGTANCVGIPVSAILIWGKYDSWGVLKNTDWGVVLFPMIVIVIVNIFYCTLCAMLLKTGEAEENSGSIV